MLKILLSILILLFSWDGWAAWPQLIPHGDMESGIGRWQEFPFGRMRLISCTTGVKDLSVVVGGLQVKLNPDWTMKRPDLKPLSENAPVWIEVPLRPGSGKNTRYQKEVFFPIIYGKKAQSPSDFEWGIQGNFPVCQENKCMTLPIRMSLSLTENENKYTTACGYILNQQRQVPLLADAMGVKGNAWREDETTVGIAFSGIKEPNVAFLQTPNQDDFSVLETQLEKTGVVMRVKTKPWENGQKKEWILITNKGVFRVPVLMQKNLVLLPKPENPISIWWMGWGLFFLSPLFIWWGLGIKRTTKQWQREIIKFGVILPAVFAVRLLLDRYFCFDWNGYLIILLGLVCLFPPKRKESALVLFLIWPCFFQTPEMPFKVFVVWFVVMYLEMMLPFVLLYKRADEIGKILRDLKKKKFFVYNLVFLIPTLIFFIGGIREAFLDKIVYQNSINENGLTLVIDEKKASKWQKGHDIFFVAPNSILGKNLKKIYNRKSSIVLWQDKWGRVILPPESTPFDFTNFISNWNTYHASYTP